MVSSITKKQAALLELLGKTRGTVEMSCAGDGSMPDRVKVIQILSLIDKVVGVT